MPADPSSSLPSAAGAAIRLAASLDLGAAPELLRQIRDALADPAADGGARVLDGSDVERVSVPCLQILAAARREAAALRVVGASAALAAAIADLGLAAAIPLES
jgi:anti-anti-sigma regulatory factor